MADRLVSLRDPSHGWLVTFDIDLDDVMMQWAVPYLRSALAASKVP